MSDTIISKYSQKNLSLFAVYESATEAPDSVFFYF